MLLLIQNGITHLLRLQIVRLPVCPHHCNLLVIWCSDIAPLQGAHILYVRYIPKTITIVNYQIMVHRAANVQFFLFFWKSALTVCLAK